MARQIYVSEKPVSFAISISSIVPVPIKPAGWLGAEAADSTPLIIRQADLLLIITPNNADKEQIER